MARLPTFVALVLKNYFIAKTQITLSIYESRTFFKTDIERTLIIFSNSLGQKYIYFLSEENKTSINTPIRPCAKICLILKSDLSLFWMNDLL